MNTVADRPAISGQQLSTLIPIAAIAPSPTNPRKTFDKARMAELASSIKSHGILQALLLRPLPASAKAAAGVRYELVAGERRWRAARDAGLEDVPALIRQLTDLQVLEMQIVENAQRDDLQPLEEAEAYEQLRRLHKYTAEQIAEKVDKSRSWVFNRLKLLTLCPEARAALRDGKIAVSIAELIARIGHHDTQRAALKDILGDRFRGPMSFREARDHIHHTYMLALKDAPFDTTLEYWKEPPKGSALNRVKIAGPCTTCPKRTGNQPELFPDVKSGDVCTDPKCFADKRAAAIAARRAEAEARGQTVISGKAAQALAPYGVESWTTIKGYVQLDAEEWVGDKRKTWRQILGKDIQPALIENVKTGELVEIVDTATLNKLLRDKGIKLGTRGTAGNTFRQEQSAQKKKAQAETRFRNAVLTAVREKLRASAATSDELVTIARAMFAEIWHENRKRVLDLWNWEEKPKSGNVEARITALRPDELRIFLMDCALVRHVYIGPYSPGDKNDPLLATATRLKIDTGSIRKQLSVNAPPASKAGKKGVKKK